MSRSQCIAEFTTNHLGNLNLLLRMVDRAAEAGADWIKMQKKDVEHYYSDEKLNASFESPYGHTYRDYRRTFEFEEIDDWLRFHERCKMHGVPWFVTVQDIPSLEFMLQFGLTRYKVASSNARNDELLQEMASQVSHECEIVASVAGSTLAEIEAMLKYFENHKRVFLLHCVAEYPCAMNRLRLGNIWTLKEKFATDRVRVGYSGHEVGCAASAVAMEIGAEMVERHFCLSRHSFAHHIECSLVPHEFARLVQFARGGRSDRKTQWAELPKEALASDFGMTEEERAFLEEQTYGRKFVGTESRF